MERRDAWALVVFLVLSYAAAAIGSLAAVSAGAEYAALEAPTWAPPGWLFGPVWTALYALIAVSGWLLWRHDPRSTEVRLWAAQLALNALWTPIFFAWGLRALALAWIVVLDAVVLVLVVRAWKQKWPAWLLVPYLAWIVFATALNASVWWLNR